MFNLLPKGDKEIARAEYYRRLISSVLGISLFSFIIISLLLIAFLINIYSGGRNTKTELNTLKNKPASNDYRDLENIVSETKTAINLLKTDLSGRPNIASILVKVLDNKPKGIFVESISWFNDDSNIRLSVSGVSSSRDLLRKYVSTLQANKSFLSVDIPVSNFAKSEDSDFSITIKVNNLNQ